MRRAWVGAILGCAMAVLLVADAHALMWQQPERMVVSPDGRHVYVSSGQGLLALARDQQSGALDLVASYPLTRTASNVQGAEPLAISPDGLSVYATRQSLSPGEPSEQPIRAFSRDPVTGLLDPRGVEGPLDPMPAGGFLVGRTHVLAAVGHMSAGRLRVYERLASGGLRSVGDDIHGLAGLRVRGFGGIDAQERLYLELDNYKGEGSSEPYEDYVGVFPFAGGSVGPGQVYPCPRQCPSHISSDGLRMYGFDAAERDSVSGALNFLEGYERTLDSNVFNTADTATWGRSIYAVDGYHHQLWHQEDTGSGWSAPDAYRDDQAGARGIAGGRALAVSPDGRHLYVAAGRWGGLSPQAGDGPFGRPTPGTIATYERDPDGKLHYRSIFSGPDQDVAVQVNGGARWTRSPLVRVQIRSSSTDPGDLARVAVAARTAGLAGARLVALDRGTGSLSWRLTGAGRVHWIYVHTWRAQGVAMIRLDRARPVVARVKRRARGRRDRLRIRVKDRGSGVRTIQVTRRRAKPGRWRAYKARRAYVVGRGRVYVRVRDKAGNASRWKAVRRR